MTQITNSQPCIGHHQCSSSVIGHPQAGEFGPRECPIFVRTVGLTCCILIIKIIANVGCLLGNKY